MQRKLHVMLTCRKLQAQKRARNKVGRRSRNRIPENAGPNKSPCVTSRRYMRKDRFRALQATDARPSAARQSNDMAKATTMMQGGLKLNWLRNVMAGGRIYNYQCQSTFYGGAYSLVSAKIRRSNDRNDDHMYRPIPERWGQEGE